MRVNEFVNEAKDKDLESEFFLKQLRARHPHAKDDQTALALDYAKSQSQDRQDIGRLDVENDHEEADIDRLDNENDNEQDEIAQLKQTISQLQQR